MLPAHKSLESDNVSRVESYDGLVEIPEFVPFERTAQVCL
jgi:hypothetical protein